MIKRLIWTIWTSMSSVLKKADKLNLSLSLTPIHIHYDCVPLCGWDIQLRLSWAWEAVISWEIMLLKYNNTNASSHLALGQKVGNIADDNFKSNSLYLKCLEKMHGEHCILLYWDFIHDKAMLVYLMASHWTGVDHCLLLWWHSSPVHINESSQQELIGSSDCFTKKQSAFQKILLSRCLKVSFPVVLLHTLSPRPS